MRAAPLAGMRVLEVANWLAACPLGSFLGVDAPDQPFPRPELLPRFGKPIPNVRPGSSIANVGMPSSIVKRSATATSGDVNEVPGFYLGIA